MRTAATRDTPTIAFSFARWALDWSLTLPLLLLSFALWSLRVAVRRLDDWDWLLTRWFPQWRVRSVTAASRLGDGWLYALITLYLAHTGQTELAGHVATCIVVAWGGSGLLKLLFRRKRPADQLIDRITMQGKGPATWSFPSQHAACAVAFALSSHPVWWPFAACVCLSRILIGAHFVGDVVAGIVVGLAAGVWG